MAKPYFLKLELSFIFAHKKDLSFFLRQKASNHIESSFLKTLATSLFSSSSFKQKRILRTMQHHLHKFLYLRIVLFHAFEIFF